MLECLKKEKKITWKLCPTALIFAEISDSFEDSCEDEGCWWLFNWPHLNPWRQVLCQSSDLEEKITCENKPWGKFRGVCFLAPGWDAASLTCAGKDCLFVGRQYLKRPFLNSQKMNCNFLRGSHKPVQRWMKKKPSPDTRQQKSPSPPNPPQETYRS